MRRMLRTSAWLTARAFCGLICLASKQSSATSDTQQRCAGVSEIRVTQSWGVPAAVEAESTSESSSGAGPFVRVDWRAEATHFRQITYNVYFQDKQGTTIKNAVVTSGEAGCLTPQETCSLRVELVPFTVLEPCTEYYVVVEAEFVDQQPCQQHRRLFRTQTYPPSFVGDLVFENYAESFWLAELRWRQPHISACVTHYRVTFEEDFSSPQFPWLSSVRGQSILQRTRIMETASPRLALADLKACTLYAFSVRAVADDGGLGAPTDAAFRTHGCSDLMVDAAVTDAAAEANALSSAVVVAVAVVVAAAASRRQM